MKIFVLGHKGMLGRYVYTYLKTQGHNVVGLSRDDMDVSQSTYTESLLSSVLYHKGVREGDVIINCIGTIKPMVDKHGILNAIKVNSVFPQLLSNVCKSQKVKMIHITTDCVYSGKKGQYNEKDVHDCTDVYGKTKSLGEPEDCTVVRTSIIGEEVTGKRSLLEWIKSMEGKEANGFTNHLWNGLTCLQVAKLFEEIIEKNKFWKGVRHIFSPYALNKKEMVEKLSNVYDLRIKVNSTTAPEACDRTLSTIYIQEFDIPPLESQFVHMHKFHDTLFDSSL